jgi:succinate dehydrogenase/fumarate reductase flavoprotein subunit
MYLTVLKMTRQSVLLAPKLLDVQSTNSVHQWLTGRQDKSRAENKLLYKLITNGDEIYLYIQSLSEFNTENVGAVGFELVKVFDLESRNYEELTYFDVQTFPYKTVNDRRYYIKDTAERYDWLKKQFEKNGIELLDFTEYKQSDIVLDNNQLKRIPTSSFRGRMKVVDPIKAEVFITNGMGRMKNYGLGLILVK